MPVVYHSGRINCEKWGLQVLKGVEKNLCRNVCIFFQAWHLSKIVRRTSLCGKLHAICSLQNEFAFHRHAKLQWKYDIKSQINLPHWCNQSNDTSETKSWKWVFPKAPFYTSRLSPATQLCPASFVPAARSPVHGDPWCPCLASTARSKALEYWGITSSG